jgi:hypothetical protein
LTAPVLAPTPLGRRARALPAASASHLPAPHTVRPPLDAYVALIAHVGSVLPELVETAARERLDPGAFLSRVLTR